jgi:hypothetical protein
MTPETSHMGPVTAEGPEPEAAEVESARLLANETRDRLREKGLPDERIDRLADAFIALDRGQDQEAFIAWALSQAPETDSDRVDQASDGSFPASDPPSTWASAGGTDAR